MFIPPRAKLVIIGDSITDAPRTRPIPTQTGHMVLARAFLDTVEFAWESSGASPARGGGA
jgi:hypothetical protein